MEEASEQFRRRRVDVVAVGFGTPEQLTEWTPVRPISLPVLVDPERKLYAALGLGRTSLLALLRPGVIAHYLRLFKRWGRPRKPQQDPWQLGGDFLVDPSGRVLWAYRSKNPADRPSITTLLQAIDRCLGQTGGS